MSTSVEESPLTNVDFPSPSTKEEFEKGQILAILPESNKYILEKYEIIETASDVEFHFKVEGRTNVRTKEELMIFIEEFSNNTGSSFNMQSGRQDRNGKKTIVHGVRKCIMNVRHDNNRKFLRSGLQRACPSKISFCLEKTPKKLVEDRPGVRAKKELVGDFPLHFSINFEHNHQLKRHEYSRFGNVSKDTQRRSSQFN